MSYVALYRKFRPSVFDDVRGQDHIVRTLRNQVLTGRLQHAYLFCGTRGTGKTSVAKILARAVNCENPVNGNPCGECASCRSIADGTSMNVIEIDAASNNGVDNIRDIIEEVQYRPTVGQYKVYIIDEVHMLSAGAFNALLKTLEEPPSYVMFILATTEAGKIPVTILSRCQRYDFHRISTDVIASRLRELTDREGVEAEEKALRFIARAGDGSMRDALSLLDRCIAFYMDEALTYEKALKALGEADTEVFRKLTEAVLAGRAGEAVALFGREMADGVETGQFISDYIWYLRGLMLTAVSPGADIQEMIDVSSEQLLEMQDLATEAGADVLIRCIYILSDLQSRLRYATNRRVLAEIAILQMARPQGEQTGEALYGRVLQLETKVDELMREGIPRAEIPGERIPEPEPVPGEEAEALPEAAPEDLKEICADWRRLLGGMEDGFVKNRLKESGIPQFNADTLENRLYIEMRGGINETADRLFVNTPDNREEIERYLARKTGKHIEVELHMAENRPQGIKTVDIDAMLQQKINMEIEVSDDGEEEEF
ncbi:MAG: DNA polymerase III subunit gamma/tau [Lachnospiraceae bacterium]|nr:DNA polymerase III subunit gamma/tau [Lachnospiraceae bacterium]